MTEESNCLDCDKHLIIDDKDPDDWFCDDDQAVVCTLVNNLKHDPNSKNLADHSVFKSITVACRPYNIRKESSRPNWCPLLIKPEDK